MSINWWQKPPFFILFSPNFANFKKNNAILFEKMIIKLYNKYKLSLCKNILCSFLKKYER